MSEFFFFLTIAYSFCTLFAYSLHQKMFWDFSLVDLWLFFTML
jgi:hypothetical protein